MVNYNHGITFVFTDECSEKSGNQKPGIWRRQLFPPTNRVDGFQKSGSLAIFQNPRQAWGAASGQSEMLIIKIQDNVGHFSKKSGHFRC